MVVLLDMLCSLLDYLRSTSGKICRPNMLSHIGEISRPNMLSHIREICRPKMLSHIREICCPSTFVYCWSLIFLSEQLNSYNASNTQREELHLMQKRMHDFSNCTQCKSLCK